MDPMPKSQQEKFVGIGNRGAFLYGFGGHTLKVVRLYMCVSRFCVQRGGLHKPSTTLMTPNLQGLSWASPTPTREEPPLQ